jgi:precorrin-6B methylase 2
MHVSRIAPGSLLALGLSLAAAAVFAQTQAQTEFKPQVGQAGKDVVWVPTSQALVEKMLDMAKLTPSDFLMDLGSGDGRTVITAAKRGARATGIEFNPNMVELSKRNAAAAGVSDRAQFVRADLFETDLSQATVITMFLLPSINLKLRPKILDLKPGTRIVANSFTMGEWQEDETASLDRAQGCTSFCTAYLWIVPAKVQGTWRLPQGELTLKQDFQMLSGTLASGGRNVAIENGRMRGDQISFAVGGAQYSARVTGGLMEGTVKVDGGTPKFEATQISR